MREEQRHLGLAVPVAREILEGLLHKRRGMGDGPRADNQDIRQQGGKHRFRTAFIAGVKREYANAWEGASKRVERLRLAGDTQPLGAVRVSRDTNGTPAPLPRPMNDLPQP